MDDNVKINKFLKNFLRVILSENKNNIENEIEQCLKKIDLLKTIDAKRELKSKRQLVFNLEDEYQSMVAKLNADENAIKEISKSPSKKAVSEEAKKMSDDMYYQKELSNSLKIKLKQQMEIIEKLKLEATSEINKTLTFGCDKAEEKEAIKDKILEQNEKIADLEKEIYNLKHTLSVSSISSSKRKPFLSFHFNTNHS